MWISIRITFLLELERTGRPIWQIFFLDFRFWGTCADHAGLLHRYIYGKVVCCLHPPHHLYLVFLPILSLPTLHTPCCPSHTYPTDCSVWCSPLCVHVFSLFNSHLWVRTCSVWFSVLVSVCWEWWFPDSSMSLQRTQIHPFLWLRSIPWCICGTFSLSNLLLLGILVGSRSFLL